MYFRLFGWPHHVHLHQYVALLRSQQLPFKVYCTSCLVTAFYSRYHGAATLLCALSPDKQTYLNMWQLADAIESGRGCRANGTASIDAQVCRVHGSRRVIPCRARTWNASISRNTSSNTRGRVDAELPIAVCTHVHRQGVAPGLLFDKLTHPNLHLVCWSTIVYASWWLGKTGHLYRYFYGDTVSFVNSLMKYFFHTNFGVHKLVAQAFRTYMLDMFATSGVNEKTADFMQEHFVKMCRTLESHLSCQNAARFLLGTRHITLADVAVGASFSCFFLVESNCAEQVLSSYPKLVDYVARVTGWQGDNLPPSPKKEHDRSSGDSRGHCTSSEDGGAAFCATRIADEAGDKHVLDDSVPDSLREFLALQAEVLPFMVSQCAAFNAYLQSDDMQQIPVVELSGLWEGCHGRILDRLTKVKSLMIVDDQVMTVCSRATDLEVAFRAAGEVFDDDDGVDERESTRVDDEKKMHLEDDADTPAHRRLVAPHESDRAVNFVVHTERLSADAAKVKCSPARSLDESRHADQTLTYGISSTDTHALYRDAVSCDAGDSSATTRRKAQSVTGIASTRVVSESDDTCAHALPVKDRLLALSEHADFYRVYTRYGLARARCTPGSVGFGEIRGEMYSHGSALLVAPSLDEQIHTLRCLLGQMRSPHYTFTSVAHKGKSCFAVISEYQAAKVRQRNRRERHRRQHVWTDDDREGELSRQ